MVIKKYGSARISPIGLLKCSLREAWRRPLLKVSLRLYYQFSEKPPVKLLVALHTGKLTEVSTTKAREALAATNTDAAKVAHRTAGEGLFEASVLARGTGSATGHGGVRAALVGLNCETDFVARNTIFPRLVADVAHTAAFLAEPGSSSSRNGSLAPPPAASSSHGIVADAIRAAAVTHEPSPHAQSELGLRVAAYAHGHGGALLQPSQAQGRVGALALVALKSPRLHAR
ncbi:hypothetical protein EI94DRAFT_1831409 [Lactarius quietus]|nr:hypothetical protein EI94DRAFT_1831409 [Lactarius quietus]